MKRGALFFCCLVGACGGSASNTAEDVPTQLAKAECSFGVRCGYFADEASCVAATAEDDGLATTVAAVKAGTIKYNGDKLAACLDDISSMDCLAFGFDGSPVQQEEKDCAAVFTGSVDLDGACNVDADCISTHCEVNGCTSACCTGTCQPLETYVVDGGDCSGGQECVVGDVCVTGQSGSPTCGKLVAHGGACTQIDQCQPGDYCDLSGAGVCARPLAVGAACDPQNQRCAAGALCRSNVCTANGAVGDTCDPSGFDCAFYESCDPSTSKCVSLAGSGEACQSSSDCLGDLTCDSTSKCSLSAPMVCP